MVIVAASISIGTLHVIVAIVLAVIGASRLARLVRFGRAIGQRLQERSDAHVEFEGASGIG